jgi:hypothetical protein
MTEIDKSMIIARFLQAGVVDLQSILGVPCIKEQAGCVFIATFFTGVGKTSFELDLETQVDPVTLNLEGYSVKHRPFILIPELVVGNINTIELEARIKAIDYMADLDTKQLDIAKAPIQNELDMLSKETRPAVQSIYLSFLAKYHQQFNFGDIKSVMELRKKKLDALYREKTYSFTGKTKMLPPAAFEEITSIHFKMTKRNIPVIANEKAG